MVLHELEGHRLFHVVLLLLDQVLQSLALVHFAQDALRELVEEGTLSHNGCLLLLLILYLSTLQEVMLQSLLHRKSFFRVFLQQA